MSDFDSMYPLEVYRHVSDKGVELVGGEVIGGQIVGGTTLPPFTRVIAEAIASTRPDWARFEDTEIGPEVRTDDHEHIYIDWARAFGDQVVVVQETAYSWDGSLVGATEFPRIRVWTDTQFEIELRESLHARALAGSLAEAAELLDQLEENPLR